MVYIYEKSLRISLVFSPKEGMTSFQRTLSGFASLHRGGNVSFSIRDYENPRAKRY